MHVCEYETFDLGVTLKGTHFIDLTERIDGMIARAGVREGTVHVISRHTTTAVTINEMEDRLVDDARMFFHELAPPGKFYLHNDLDRRHGPITERPNLRSDRSTRSIHLDRSIDTDR